jgi:hypothetical protein
MFANEGYGASGKARKTIASVLYEIAPKFTKMPALPRLKREERRGSLSNLLLSMQLITVVSPMEPLKAPKATMMLKAKGETMMRRHTSTVNKKVKTTALVGISRSLGTCKVC